MTVASSTNKATFHGNGVTRLWPFGFPVLAEGHLQVFITAPDGTETKLAGGYTVTLAGTGTGGTVTYPVSGPPLAAGHRITLRRVVPLQQDTDLANQDGFYAEVHETAFDKAAMVDQQQQEELNRALKVPSTDPTTGVELPVLGRRAGRVLAFDTGGAMTATESTAAQIDAVVQAGAASGGVLARFSFIGDGETREFDTGYGLGASTRVLLFVGGAAQDSFTVTGSRVVVPEPPPAGVKVYGRVIGVTTDPPPGGSVSRATPLPLGAATSGDGDEAAPWNHVHPAPTAADIGALPAAGGTLSGNVRVDGEFRVGPFRFRRRNLAINATTTRAVLELMHDDAALGWCWDSYGMLHVGDVFGHFPWLQATDHSTSLNPATGAGVRTRTDFMGGDWIYFGGTSAAGVELHQIGVKAAGAYPTATALMCGEYQHARDGTSGGFIVLCPDSSNQGGDRGSVKIVSYGQGGGAAVRFQGRTGPDTIGEHATFDANQFRGVAGTDAAPGWSFYGDTDTGLSNPGSDTVGVSTGGSRRLTINSATAVTTCALSSNAASADIAGLRATATSSSSSIAVVLQNTGANAAAGVSLSGDGGLHLHTGFTAGGSASVATRRLSLDTSGNADLLTGALRMAGTPVISSSRLHIHRAYTVATVPNAAANAWAEIGVTDEAGGAVLAFSDGANWRRVTDRGVIA